MAWLLVAFSIGILAGAALELSLIRREQEREQKNNYYAHLRIRPRTIYPEHVEPFCGVDTVHKHYDIDIFFHDRDDHHISLFYCPLTGRAKPLNLFIRDRFSFDPLYEEKANHWGE